MRRRVVHPDFFEHEDLYDAGVREGARDLPTQLLFAGLWCFADREGRFPYDLKRIRRRILPFHNYCKPEEVLNALESAGFVKSYTVAGKKYGWIPSFRRWQPIHPNEAKSLIPAHPDECVIIKSDRQLHIDVTNDNGNGNANGDGLGGLGENSPTALSSLGIKLNPEQRLICALNHGLDLNPALPGFNPVPISHPASLEVAADILAQVPLPFAMEKVCEIATNYKPNGRHRQINTLRYCIDAVLSAWDAVIASIAAKSQSVTGPSAEFDNLRKVISAGGGFRYFTKEHFDKLPDAVRAGISAAGGIKVIADADGTNARETAITRARFIEGYSSHAGVAA